MPLVFLNVLCGHIDTAKRRGVNTDHILTVEEERAGNAETGTPAVTRITITGGRTMDVRGSVEDVCGYLAAAQELYNEGLAGAAARGALSAAPKLSAIEYPPGTVNVPIDAQGNPAAPATPPA